MTYELAFYGLLTLVSVILSAMFSGLETGLYTINRVRVAVRAGRGELAAVRIRAMLRNPTRMLTTLLLGNNIVNYTGSLGIAAILNHIGATPLQAVAINAGILVPLLFVFGETLPKDLFRTYTDVWSYRLAGFLTWTGRILTAIGLLPLVQSFGHLVGRMFGSDIGGAASARQHISHLIAEGVGAGVISEAQTTLADRALAMRDRRVGDEMVPWRRVLRIPVEASSTQRVDYFRRHAFTHAPVVDRGGQVLGVLNVVDAVLEPDKPTHQLLKPVAFFQPNMHVQEALQAMRQQRSPMGIVTGRGMQRPIGIVTYKDLVEPLTGELAAW